MAETKNQSNDYDQKGWRVSKKFLRFWDSLIIFFIGIVILLVILRIAVGIMGKTTTRTMSYLISEEPAEEAILSETEFYSQPNPTESAMATLEPEYGEVTDKTINTANKRLGEVEVSIPRLISPKSSNIISVSIYRPLKLASADPTTFLIVEIDDDSFKTISSTHGELFQDQRTILIDEQMKVEIVASAFDVERLFPLTQMVEIEELEKPTRWAWSIIAPETEGVHIINIKVYVDEESETPSWFGAYQIKVQEPVPTPSDTPIPSSELIDSQESDLIGIVDSLKFILDLLAVASTIIGGVFAIVRPYIKKRVTLLESLKKTQSSLKTK